MMSERQPSNESPRPGHSPPTSGSATKPGGGKDARNTRAAATRAEGESLGTTWMARWSNDDPGREEATGRL